MAFTKQTGKRIRAVLDPQATQPIPAESSLPTSSAEPVVFGDPNQTWLEDLLVTAPSHPSEAITRFGREDRFEVALDGTAVTPSFRLAGPGTVPGFLCSEVRVASVAELMEILEVSGERL